MTGLPRYTARDLLQHLAAELDSLATTADDVQHAAMDIARQQTDDAGLAGRIVVTLQSLDTLSQVLRDMHRLALAMSRGAFGRVAIDPDEVRGALVLHSLGERLLSGPQHGADDSAGNFLL